MSQLSSKYFDLKILVELNINMNWKSDYFILVNEEIYLEIHLLFYTVALKKKCQQCSAINFQNDSFKTLCIACVILIKFVILLSIWELCTAYTLHCKPSEQMRKTFGQAYSDF
jgi:hypothetical protein